MFLEKVGQLEKRRRKLFLPDTYEKCLHIWPDSIIFKPKTFTWLRFNRPRRSICLWDSLGLSLKTPDSHVVLQYLKPIRLLKSLLNIRSCERKSGVSILSHSLILTHDRRLNRLFMKLRVSNYIRL